MYFTLKRKVANEWHESSVCVQRKATNEWHASNKISSSLILFCGLTWMALEIPVSSSNFIISFYHSGRHRELKKMMIDVISSALHHMRIGFVIFQCFTLSKFYNFKKEKIYIYIYIYIHWNLLFLIDKKSCIYFFKSTFLFLKSVWPSVGAYN